jgi:hypothetical protein
LQGDPSANYTFLVSEEIYNSNLNKWIRRKLVEEFLSTIIDCEDMDAEDAEVVQQLRELVFEHKNHAFITMETNKEAVKIMFSD